MSEKPAEDDFKCMYHEVRRAVAEIGLLEHGTEDAFDWLNKVLEYNVNDGEHTRGRLVATSLRALVNPPLEADVKTAYVLGWCVEMLQAYFELSYDFILQRSHNHNGKQCWHHIDGIGILSINDAVYVEAAMYHIIRKYTADKSYYGAVMELFREATMHKIVGQRIELNMYSNGQLDWNLFTMTAYESITLYKRAFYSTYLPAACAMYMVGIKDEESHTEAKKILLEIGQLKQIQDDYINCFSKVDTPGAGHGHNQDMACTWLSAQAGQLASDRQKEELQACFSEGNDLAAANMRDIYTCLGLQTAYRFLKESRLQKIARMIGSCSGRQMESMFVSILENVLAEDTEMCTL